MVTDPTEELELLPLVDMIEIWQLQCFGHIMRMREDRYPKEIFGMKCEGRRLRVEWEDNTREATGRRGQHTGDGLKPITL